MTPPISCWKFHHIRPSATGGATEMPNLMTLCQSCHAGLDPHFDRSSFDYVNPFDAAKLLPCFEDGVANYRRVTA
ncbi:HNH endonuclease [Sphingobium sp. Cam5-1]|nr:HNH endonuclease [Sphingobium sp. Cam5-1]